MGFRVTFESSLGHFGGRSAQVTFKSLLGQFNSVCVSAKLGARPLHNFKCQFGCLSLGVPEKDCLGARSPPTYPLLCVNYQYLNCETKPLLFAKFSRPFSRR